MGHRQIAEAQEIRKLDGKDQSEGGIQGNEATRGPCAHGKVPHHWTVKTRADSKPRDHGRNI